MTAGRPRGLPRFVGSVGLCLCVALLGACSGSDGAVERPGVESSTTRPGDESEAPVPEGSGTIATAGRQALRLGLSGIDTLDPAVLSPAEVDEVVLADLLYDTLTVLRDGRAAPGLASFSSNPELTVWRFVLDQGATFADGSPVTADDVRFSLERVVGQGDESLAALRIEDVESITAPDPKTVEIVLGAPSAVLPEVLSAPAYGITSRATMEAAFDGGDLTPNTSSEFAATLEGVDRLVLERRSGDGVPTVVVERYVDADQALDGLLAGEVDWVAAPPERLGEVTAAPGVRSTSVPFHGTLSLGIDPSTAPLADGDVRRAIALALDRGSIAAAVFGPAAQAAPGLVPAGVPGGGGECRGPCGPDLAAARDLVERALPDGQARTLQLLVDDSESQRSIGGLVQEQLGRVGLEVEVETVDVATYEDLVADGRQQLFLYGWLGVSRSPADHLVPLFRSGSPDNLTGMSAPPVDDALSVALTAADPAARADRWRVAEAEILRRAPVVPLVQFRTTGVTSSRVDGLVIRADGSIDLSGLTLAGA